MSKPSTKNAGNALGIVSLVIALIILLPILNWFFKITPYQRLEGLPLLITPFISPIGFIFGIISIKISSNKFGKWGIISNVIFNWVIHYEDIFSLILQPLNDLEFEIIKVTLICSEETLKKRIINDIQLNLRDDEDLIRSIERLGLYKNMDTIKVDTTDVSVLETADKIIKIIHKCNKL